MREALDVEFLSDTLVAASGRASEDPAGARRAVMGAVARRLGRMEFPRAAEAAAGGKAGRHESAGLGSEVGGGGSVPGPGDTAITIPFLFELD